MPGHSKYMSLFFLNGVGMTGFKTKQGPRSLQRCRPSDSSTGMCVCVCIKRNLEKGLEAKTDKKKETEFLIQNSAKKYPWYYSHTYDIIIK